MRKLPIVLLLPLLACSPQSEPQLLDEREPAPPGLATATPQDVEPLYLDVRTAEEFAAGHVVGAVNIPHDEMPERWQEIAEHSDRPVVLYCRTGRRSAMAEQVLRERGFTRTTNARTLDALAAQGVPTTR